MPRTKLVQVDAQVNWRCFRGKGGNWVAICDPLQLTVQSRTWSELMEDIGATLDGVLNDVLSSNELPRFLKDRGWRIAGSTLPQKREPVRFEVPFAAMQERHDSERALH